MSAVGVVRAVAVVIEPPVVTSLAVAKASAVVEPPVRALAVVVEPCVVTPLAVVEAPVVVEPSVRALVAEVPVVVALTVDVHHAGASSS